MPDVLPDDPKNPEPIVFKYGKKWAWDCYTGSYHLLPDTLRVNPFDPKYKIAQPISFIEIKGRHSESVPRKVPFDANGVRLNLDCRAVCRRAYPDHVYGLGKLAGYKVPKKAYTRGIKILKYLALHMNTKGELDRYMDRYGNLKTEAVIGFWLFLQKLILSRPEVIAKYFAQLYEDTLNNPKQTLKDFHELTGLPIQVMNSGEGNQLVQIKVMQDDDDKLFEIEQKQIDG